MYPFHPEVHRFVFVPYIWPVVISAQPSCPSYLQLCPVHNTSTCIASHPTPITHTCVIYPYCPAQLLSLDCLTQKVEALWSSESSVTISQQGKHSRRLGPSGSACCVSVPILLSLPFLSEDIIFYLLLYIVVELC
jgi:hypothetical protein